MSIGFFKSYESAKSDILKQYDPDKLKEYKINNELSVFKMFYSKNKFEYYGIAFSIEKNIYVKSEIKKEFFNENLSKYSLKDLDN